MPAQIRPAILSKITHALDSTLNHINAHDFIIESKGGQVIIRYQYKTGVLFKFSYDEYKSEYTIKQEYNSGTAAISALGGMEIKTKEVTKEDFHIKGIMAPGGLSLEERFSIYGTDKLIKKLENWINYIWEDLSAEPAIRIANSYQEQLNEFLNEWKFEEIPNGDTFFSKQEAEDLLQKLATLEASFSEKLNEVIQDKEQLAQELNELKKEFDGFRQTAHNLDKKNWFKSVMTKLFMWGAKKENQQLLQAAAACGKTFLESKTN